MDRQDAKDAKRGGLLLACPCRTVPVRAGLCPSVFVLTTDTDLEESTG